MLCIAVLSEGVVQGPFLQVRLIRQSEVVSLGLMQPGVVVTGGVTSFRLGPGVGGQLPPPVHSVRSRPEVSGMSAFGHYLLACRWRVGVCQSGTIGQGPLHV